MYFYFLFFLFSHRMIAKNFFGSFVLSIKKMIKGFHRRGIACIYVYIYGARGGWLQCAWVSEESTVRYPRRNPAWGSGAAETKTATATATASLRIDGGVNSTRERRRDKEARRVVRDAEAEDGGPPTRSTGHPRRPFTGTETRREPVALKSQDVSRSRRVRETREKII